jgi:hypothetical protein
METKNFEQLEITKAENGFIVYANKNYIDLSDRNVIARKPLVFETMENLFKFIEQNFKIN